jgi:hypothetical protein
MERSVALKKLRRMFGDGLGYQVNKKVPTPEEREAARADLPAAIAARNDAGKKRDARYQAILKGDAEYQALRAADDSRD